MSDLEQVFNDIRKERQRQDVKWGVQNHDHFTWLVILGEEKGEADKAALESRFGNAPATDYRKELIETAAVAVAAVECFDRHSRNEGGVYLAGPIKNCDQNQVHGWRDDAKLLLKCHVCDPSVRDFSQSECHDCMNEIVNPDKNEIDSCSILLANCWQISVGTSQEILYAWERGKLVVSIVPEDRLLSAWTVAHSHKLVHTVEEACDYINSSTANDETLKAIEPGAQEGDKTFDNADDLLEDLGLDAPKDGGTIDFKQIVLMALGEASMAWSPRPSGVFLAEDCEIIGNRIIQAHKDLGPGEFGDINEELIDQQQAMQEDIEDYKKYVNTLQAQVKKYGMHLTGCDNTPCTCGLAEIQ